jgi:hypothetical protein
VEDDFVVELEAGQECLKPRHRFIVDAQDCLVGRADDIYYVLPRRRYCDPFLADGSTMRGLANASILVTLLVIPIMMLVYRLQHSWKVGVVRFAADGSEKPRVIYVDKLPAKVMPDVRVAELVAEIEAGAFDRDRDATR